MPIAAGSNTFALQYKGQPVAGKQVTVIEPGLWRKTFKTDAQGRIAVPDRGAGKYILLCNHEVTGAQTIGGVEVQSVTYVTSLSFIVK